MGQVRPRLFSRKVGDIAFATLSLGLIAQLGACATSEAPREAPLETQTDEVADLSQSDSSSGTSYQSTDEAAASRPRRPRQESTAGPRLSYGRSRAPRIAAAPFKSGAQWMNAFYFIRDEAESWESVSSKLYARADRASLLKSWNSGKALEVGSVIYYNSPFRPEDSQNMKVFAEDFGGRLESVTIQGGDWLSKIGLAKYGNVRTWMEIAALNPELGNPDLIEVGQSLRLQPTQVDTQAALNRLIQEVQTQAATTPLPDPEPGSEAASNEASVEDSSALSDMPGQLDQEPVKTEKPTKVSQGPPKSEDYMLFGALALLCVAISWIVIKRLRARREQVDAPLAQVTTLPTRSKTGS